MRPTRTWLVLALMILGASCIATSTTYTIQFPGFMDGFGEVRPVMVTLVDETSAVQAVAYGGSAKGRVTGASQVDGDPNAITLDWVGCRSADRTVITLRNSGARYLATFREETSRPCGSESVQRVLLVTLVRQIPPGLVDAEYVAE
jgi:hypothetical protein